MDVRASPSDPTWGTAVLVTGWRTDSPGQFYHLGLGNLATLKSEVTGVSVHFWHLGAKVPKYHNTLSHGHFIQLTGVICIYNILIPPPSFSTNDIDHVNIPCQKQIRKAREYKSLLS